MVDFVEMDYAAIAVPSVFEELRETLDTAIRFANRSGHLIQLRRDAMSLMDMRKAIEDLLAFNIWSPNNEFPTP